MREVRAGPQFADLEQQADGAAFGMWVFLATEVLFFGGAVLRLPVLCARISRTGSPRPAGTPTIVLGTLNTAILLTSSFVHGAGRASGRSGRRGAGGRGLLGVRGAVRHRLPGLKGIEYRQEWDEHLVPGRGFARRKRAGHARRTGCSCSSSCTSC